MGGYVCAKITGGGERPRSSLVELGELLLAERAAPERGSRFRDGAHLGAHLEDGAAGVT